MSPVHAHLPAIRRCALAVAVTLAPSTIFGAPVVETGRLEDVTSEQRLRLSAVADGSEASVEVGGRVTRGALAYRFRLLVTDSTGAAIAAPGAWEATVLIAGRATQFELRPLLFLGSAASELTLPRPLGFRLDEGDSLVFVASLAPGTAPGARRFVLVLDYESEASGATRLAVAPLPAADGLVRRGASSAEWRWTPSSDGRLLALAGLPLADVREMALDDLTTGATVWSTTLRDAEGGAVFGKPGEVVRLGAAVVAGHTYRLRATLGRAISAGQSPEATIVAMIFPAGQARR